MKITINKPTEFEAVYLKVDAGVRYWEDAEVNGVRDIDLCESKGIGKPLIPCAVQIKEEADYNIYSDHYRWRPIIAMKTTSPLLLMTAMYLRLCVRQMKDMATTSL